MPIFRSLFLALCLCLVPCLPHAEGLFIIDYGASDTDSRDDLQIIPVTSSNQKMSPRLCTDGRSLSGERCTRSGGPA